MGFRLGSIPVQIHLSFFLTAVILSAGRLQQNPVLVVEWAAVVLVSVMIHELGHALTGRVFGLSPRIDLHGMGGTTSWTQARGKITPTKSVLISVAGPGVGIVVGAIVYAVVLDRFGAETLSLLLAGKLEPTLTQQIALDVIWVNAGWGFVNLLPVLPMDGGNVLLTLLNAATKGRGERPARVISIVTALLGGTVAWIVFHDWWPALLAAMFAYDNFRALRALSAAADPAPTPLR